MTTQVVIMSPRPNHHRLRVAVLYRNEHGQFMPSGRAGDSDSAVVLDDGECHVAYVHAGAQLLISEVLRETATETAGAALDAA